jgi:4-hydroxybenzoate polyprenyltransferase
VRARPVDYLFLLRPALLAPVWTIFLLGYGRAGALRAGLWLGLIATTAAFGSAFVLNQVFDVESDRHNRKCPFLSTGLISRKQALGFYGVLLLLALIGAWYARGVGLVVLCVAALGVLYSAPPWRLKDRPYAALAANAVAHGVLAFLAGRLAAGTDWGPALPASLPYACGVAAVYLHTTIPDLDGDRLAGKQTLAVTLGAARAARWALGWYLSALLLALYRVDVLFLLAVLPAAPAFARAGRGHMQWVPRAVRWSVIGLSCAAVFTAPWYAAVLALGLWSTRVYYRRTWGLSYP